MFGLLLILLVQAAISPAPSAAQAAAASQGVPAKVSAPQQPAAGVPSQSSQIPIPLGVTEAPVAASPPLPRSEQKVGTSFFGSLHFVLKTYLVYVYGFLYLNRYFSHLCRPWGQ